MARKKTTSEEKKTVLLVPLTDARTKITEQLQMGYSFLEDTPKIKNEDDLRIIQTAHKIWFDYTRELLNQIFNTDDLAKEFEGSGRILYVIGRFYPLVQQIQDLQTCLRRNLDALISIDARLNLFSVISAKQEGSEPDMGLSIKKDELTSLQKQLRQHLRNLNRLREEEAKVGFDYKLLNLIDDEKEAIKEKQERLKELEAEVKEREQVQNQLEKLKELQAILSDYLCPHCGAKLVTKEYHVQPVEYNGRDLEVDHEFVEYECGYSTHNGKEASPCKNLKG